MSRIFIGLAALALAGCGSTGQAVRTEVKTVYVTKRGPCPDPATFAALKTSRPVKLTEQEMPENAAVRVAVTSAQLGLYEAPGRWSDQAWAALERCQTEKVEESEKAP